MRMSNQNNRRKFYVIQFLHLPFKIIDKYVCVPYSWLIIQRPNDPKVVVTYPNNEDPFDTRDRVKRKERPNDEWKLYAAIIKYESENYGDAEYWIATRSNYGDGEEESEIKIRDIQPEPVLNTKLRSTNKSFCSDKRQLTVKANKNPRKPLQRISIRRPLSQGPNKNLDNKRLKLNENAKPEIMAAHVIIDSGRSKQERSGIIMDKQLIQNHQTKTSFASNSEMNTVQSTHPEVIKENQSIHMSVQSSSKKILTEQQPSPTFPAEQKLSPVGLDYQESLSMPVIHLDESNEDIESCQNVLPEPVVEERSALMVRHKHSLPEPHSLDLSVRKSKDHDESQKTNLNRILTASKIVSRPPSTAYQPLQQYIHPQSSVLPVSSILCSTLKPQIIDQRNSIKVVHNRQKLRFQGSMQSTPSTSHSEPNWKKLSQQCTSSTKTQIPVVKNLKNTVDKKTRLEVITKKITTMQYPTNSTKQLSSPIGVAVMQSESLAQNHLQQARLTSSSVNNIGNSMGKESVNKSDPFSEDIKNASAAQNLSKLGHQCSSFVEASREQQYLSTQEDCLQQFARMQDMLRTPNMARTIDQRVHHQNIVMNRGFTTKTQSNPINQFIQFLPQNYNQYIPVNSAYAQGVITRELPRRSMDGAHTTYKPIVQNGVNIEPDAHNSLNQSHQNSKHPQQKQYPPNYEEPCTANTQDSLPLKSKHSSHIIRPQLLVNKKSRSLSTLKIPGEALSDAQNSYLFQKIDLQSRVNQSYTEYDKITLADVREMFTVEPAPTTKDSQVQTMLSSDRQYDLQSTLAQSCDVYREPCTKKNMVDQATETDLIMDIDHCIAEIARSAVGENTPKVVDSVCQTDEWLIEEQGSLYQEIASNSASETKSKIKSENGVISEANPTTLTALQNLTPGNQQIQSRIDIEQDMLNIFGTLLTQMGANLSLILDMFHNLRDSTLVCAQTSEKLLEQVNKFNSIETLQFPTSTTNNVTLRGPQMTQGGSAEDNIKIGVSGAPIPIREQRGTFSLPAEYDPNDSKWTLKYREYQPGLVELLPRTGVYVSKKELNHRIQESTDCKKLARLLLTEVFSKNALSVCSLTDGIAKAYNSMNIAVRPGLDEHARMVLLAFVEEYGNKRGWITSDTPAVISSIRTKIYEIRAKHAQACDIQIVK